MAGSANNPGDVVSFSITVNGNPIPDTSRVLTFNIEKRVNRIPVARVVLLDGNSSSETFAISSSSTFVPGGEISISIGYNTNPTLVFKGIITGQSLRVDTNIGSALEVECRDSAVKMAIGRKSVSFSNKKDSDIISSIIGTYPGLSASVTATGSTWPEMVQYYTTDWDFILSRAETNGMIVTCINGKVSAFAPDASTTPVISVTYGNGLYEFNADLNALSQIGTVKASAWDFKNQVLNTGQAANTIAGPGNISSKKLSEVVNLNAFALQSAAPYQNTDLSSWSKAQMLKSEFSKITGEAKIQGTSQVEPGNYITLQGLGDRFNGDYLVSGVEHTVSDGNWMTELSLGLSPVWFTSEPDVMAPPAAGLLPGVQGLFTGTVKKLFDDPDNQYRILVDIPLFDPNGAGFWARLANFYSTSGAGAFFLPEVGDEVVLGFLNDDPTAPVILGSMYSNTKIKPFDSLNPAEKNPLKAIVSKSQLIVKFDDENKVLTLVTPSNNTVVLSDKDKKITIQDQNSNSIIMDESGIQLSSNKDIQITAKQNLVLKGKQGVQIESQGGDVQIKGMNVKQNANMQYTAQGGQSAQVSGGMELTLKGAMVMIN